MPMSRERYIAVWLRMLAEKEVRTARSSQKLFISQGKAVQAAFLEGGEPKAEQALRQSADNWGRLLVATYTTTVRDFARFMREQLGLEKKANFLDLVSGFISREALSKATLITDGSVDIAKRVIKLGVETGQGEAQIAKSLREALGGSLSNSRARTIARTEVHNAATYGMDEQAKQTEMQMVKSWISVEDSRTRPEHAQAESDNQNIPMDQPFNVGGELIDRPGEGSPENAINCRCVVDYTPQNMEF